MWKEKGRNIFLILIIIFFSVTGARSSITIEKCLVCHAKRELGRLEKDGTFKSLFVDVSLLKVSVHKKKVCTDCHYDVAEIPHKTRPGKVMCKRCHYKGNPEGAPQSDKYLEYEESIHAIKAKEGNPKAPLCQDCHGTHDVLPTKDPLSKTSKTNIPYTCGKCHEKEKEEYLTGIHGKALLEKRIPEAPSCTTCHGEHNILEPMKEKSKVSPINVVKTCSECHSAINIVGKYGIKVEQVTTFERSFHGIVIKFGEKKVANCASCHGSHAILPPDDPNSSVNLNNIPKTCGKPGCHPGANINYAKGKIHVNPHEKETGIIYYVSLFFKWLTILTMCGLIIHIILDLQRRARKWKEKKGER
jgi:DnaJ-class molecular chaperone